MKTSDQLLRWLIDDATNSAGPTRKPRSASWGLFWWGAALGFGAAYLLSWSAQFA